MEQAAGAQSNTLRSVSASFDVLPTTCNGSVEYKQGNTKILCTVIGPSEIQIKNEKIDRATVEVNFIPASIKSQSPFHREMALICREIANRFIIGTMYPRSMITITIQEIIDDGSILAASINAMALALANASIAMRSLFCAVAVAVGDGGFVVDPTAAQQAAACNSCAVFVSALNDYENASLHACGAFSKDSLCSVSTHLKQIYPQVFELFRGLLNNNK